MTLLGNKTSNASFYCDFLSSSFSSWKAKGCRLMDESGTSYLDTRNNVAHVGHGHAHVVRAVQNQVATLNTNTRYLHPTMTLLAERLIQRYFNTNKRRMRAPGNGDGDDSDSDNDSSRLQVVFFTNSGSEANDLALRLARAYSVVDGAYHGHTLGTLEVSPYKYECGCEYPAILQDKGNRNDNKATTCRRSPGRHIYKVPAPDVYRGKHRDVKTAGVEYATYVQDACRHYTSQGEKVRAFIVEGGMSVAGVILPPPGYLEACARAVRAAGGLYIADEVQTGLGRLGSCFWAFEYDHTASATTAAATDQDSSPLTSKHEATTVPDIVTIGKPFGNGMPLAAVVTSRKVAAAFENCGVEYFNTFGGNPVCAAAGLAVLDVLESEGLQQHALYVGNYLKNRFLVLQHRLHLIGDVRGSGLFMGVELVKDQTMTREPAPVETSYICSILKSKYRILTSIDGPHDNVLVIKPPLVFGTADADYFVDCFEHAATVDMIKEDLSTFHKTPT
jgi:ethanolamine-phosphate phospho-lyase